MVEVELYYDGGTPVGHYDPQGLVPTSATLTLYKPDGTTISAPTVTLPTLSTTTQGGTTASALVLGAVTGLQRGSHLRLACDGVTYVVEVARVDGSTVHLTAALPVVPDASSPVKALDMSATVAAPGVANVGAGHRLAWVYSDGTTERRHGQAAMVVRWPWLSPVSAADVRELLASHFNLTRAEAYCQAVADKVADNIRSALLQTGRRPSLYVSPDVFKPVVEAGILYALASRGIHQGQDPYAAQHELRWSFNDGMEKVLTSALGYDSDQDGKLSGRELKPLHFTLQVVR